MTQPNETVEIIVYPNRHMRCKKLEWNDTGRGTYISLRAIQALMKTGINFKFLKETKHLEDITAKMNLKVYTYRQRKSIIKHNETKEFDAYGNR